MGHLARGSRAALVLAFVFVFVPLHSGFAETTPAVAAARLEVQASADCVSRADLVARVRARSPRVSFVEGESAIDIRAQFSPSPSGGVVGDVTLASPGAKPAQRRVLGRSCPDAADAVALIIAVTLDPSAIERAGASDDASVATAPPAAPPPTAPSRTPAPVNDREPSSVTDDAARGADVGIVAQLAAQSVVGPAPGLMPGVALYLQLSLERTGLWAPAAWWGITHVGRSSIEAPGGVASFWLDAASFDACPLRLQLGRFEARPCAWVLGGRLSARGSETRNAAAESHRPFWIVGGSAVLRAQLFWRLEASLRVAAGATLVRDSFMFTPEVFHTASPLSGAASLGVGLRMW